MTKKHNSVVVIVIWDVWDGPAKVMFDFELAALASADQQELQP